MVPLTSYFVDQSNQCNGSSELQRFNPKNWVVFTHSFLQCRNCVLYSEVWLHSNKEECPEYILAMQSKAVVI